MSPIYEEQYSPVKDALPDKATLFSRSDIDINTIYYEISGICNAKCTYCPTGSGVTKGRPARFIPPEEFSRGLNRLYELSLLTNDVFFGLFNWGDPLLHPQLNEILHILKEADQSFALSTNGSFIPKNLNSSLLDNLSYIRFSLPGFSQKSYDKIHRLDFEKVLQNIGILNELVPPDTLEVLLYAYKFNTGEISRAFEYFSNKNIRFQVGMPHLMDYEDAVGYLTETIDPVKKQGIEDDLFTDHIKSLLLYKEDKKSCPYLQNQLVIDEYNNVLTCCVLSKNSEYYTVGSLFELTKDEIFDVKTRGQPICSRCMSAGVPYWYEFNCRHLPQELQAFNTQTYCYIDTGYGFSEKQKVSSNVNSRASRAPFHAFFDLRGFNDIKALRWDPVEGRLCHISIDKIQVEMKNGDVRLVEPENLTTNGERISDNELRFDTIDPWFVIPAEGQINNVVITGSWLVKDVDETIPHLNQEIVQSNMKIQSLQQTITDHDAQVALLDEQVEQLTEETQSLQGTISERDAQIAPLNERIKQQAAQLMRLSNELASIKQSIVWRLLMKYHSGFVERALPQNTCRRELYDLGLKGCRILVNEGIRGLCWHYKERKRVKKIESGLDFQTDNHIKEVIESALEIQDIRDIVFDRPAKNPDVSIIIPVYNNIDYTLKCLKSISLNTKGSFEVVMVDDASKDDVQDALKNIGNITVIRNENNVGFVESCNRGAKRCKGKYILFLNNDTIVTEDWLEPLIQAMELQGVGAAGAKLVYPAGRLQEAGGIIWNDASGWNYGRGDDPAKSEYNFVRDVDYCSGAALIVRRDLFEGLGGFDEQFKPGYYEDTDLCFSIRDLGYRVLYQPRSVVIHFEGLTSGTDINTGMKRYQEVNKKKFLRKWNEVLTKEHYKPDPMNLFPARIRRDGKKILVIDHYVPTFDRDSGSFRMYHLLKILVDLGHKVTFIGDNLARLEPYTTELQQSGVEILHQPYISSIEEYLVNKGNFFDIVILSRAHIAKKHIYSVRRYCSNAKIIFDTVDLQFLRESRRAEVEDNSNILVEAEKLKQLELQLARLSDVTLVVSPIEKEILRKEDPSLQVDVVSNIHKINKCLHSFSEREGIMFLGGFAHMPNVDGVKWFVEEIFPLIKENIPDLVFYIVGNEPPEDIKSLNSQDIIVTGYVEDLSPYFDNCRVFVSPLRYGAGVKGKINQSMSYGLPVVTTSVGAEGMALVDGKNALISDRPEEFADNVVELYRNEQLWSVLSRNSIKNVRENFSYDMAKETLREMIDNLRVKS